MKCITEVLLSILESIYHDREVKKMFKKKIIEAKKIDTLIGKETVMNGKLEAKGIIRIDGNYEGEINTESDVIIGENAVVKAKVKCSSLTLAGRLEGSIKAENKLDIRSTGVLNGDASAAVLAVEEGAFFNGNCRMEIKEKNRLEKNSVRILERKSQKKVEAVQEGKK